MIGNQPDPIWHRWCSFAKSAVRILAAGSLGVSWFGTAGTLFLLAEVLGVVEELV